VCRQEIDNDGDVVDSKGKSVGHVALLGDILAPEAPPEEPKETEEEVAAKKKLEQDKKLASQLSAYIEQSVDKIKPPILNMITEVRSCLRFTTSTRLTHPQAIDSGERQPKEERDEQKLVDTVKPLLEEDGSIL
jgi:hypothetical protein